MAFQRNPACLRWYCSSADSTLSSQICFCRLMQLGDTPVFLNFFLGGGRNFKKKKICRPGTSEMTLVAWVLSLGPHGGRKEPTPITYALMATLRVWCVHAYTHKRNVLKVKQIHRLEGYRKGKDTDSYRSVSECWKFSYWSPKHLFSSS